MALRPGFQKNIKRFSDEDGQAAILIAGMFIVLAAFVGLVVDIGILFIQHGYLRRAVDTAALAAASEFRLGQTPEMMERSARELVALNMPELNLMEGATEVIVETCADSPLPEFCADDGNRKFVRVTAEHEVEFVFLRVIGIRGTTIHAEATSEAAAIELVLVIDTSESMAFDVGCDGDDDDGDGEVDDGCPGEAGKEGAYPDDYYRNPVRCNPAGECHPFEEVRDAARKLMDQMYFPYDRVAVVTFDRVGRVAQDLTPSRASVDAVLDDLEIFNKDTEDPDWVGINCPGFPPDPTGCLSTNSGDGLKKAGQILSGNGRKEAVWVVIFLSDGIANTANSMDTALLTIPPQKSTLDQWYCPYSTRYAEGVNEIGPYCSDGLASTRHSSSDLENYDAEDYARDMADWLGCPDPETDGQDYCGGLDGLGTVIFSVGLGDRVLDAHSGKVGVYTQPIDRDLGEQLLRYIANVGYDANPHTDECDGVPEGTSCGNYYFAREGADVAAIFEQIGDRIFTRITR